MPHKAGDVLKKVIKTMPSGDHPRRIVELLECGHVTHPASQPKCSTRVCATCTIAARVERAKAAKAERMKPKPAIAPKAKKEERYTYTPAELDAFIERKLAEKLEHLTAPARPADLTPQEQVAA